ncbi:hypothetical protein [Geomicrobium sediminis]|uniref:Uncharacterized protein n=1 Tax=Geomicrobium sediminis TaxID=1347788 RepID=A0ABS2PG18_9BACL|nr:hypothetical protein [Geomicrobium sediminis]EZH64351.1 hypothetical protein DH09_01155 [Bacillaceae bacterium JMAK1]MBM7634217.1 hypothetical protein [Geomicrobium sediminis]
MITDVGPTITYHASFMNVYIPKVTYHYASMNMIISIIDAISQLTEENVPGVSAIEVEVYSKSLDEYEVKVLWDIACKDLLGASWVMLQRLFIGSEASCIYFVSLLETIEYTDIERRYKNKKTLFELLKSSADD